MNGAARSSPASPLRGVLHGIGVALLGFCGVVRAEGAGPASPEGADLGFNEVVFAVRTANGTGDRHWYANFGYYCPDPARKAYGANGHLCKLNLKTLAVTNLVSDPQGAVRDPAVSYDGKKILFSYRRGGTEDFNLYEINADGTGLKQLTEGPYNDIEPCYLPDGGIVFSSSRCNRYVNCWLTQVATVYRCDGDGRNIRPLSPNIEQDNTPWVLPDGRILYTRWEYVDRNQVSFHHLWFMRPDGTGQMVYFGNMHPWNVFIDAKPIPGTASVVMVNSPAHGSMEHAGRISIVSAANGPDDLSQLKVINEDAEFRDPYPLSPRLFLVARMGQLLWMKADGSTTPIFSLSGPLAAGGAWLHEPRPIVGRPREPALAPQVKLSESTGKLLLLDAYAGRNMRGVKRGDIRKLLVLETLPKPVNYTGGMDPMTYGGSFTMNRVLGTVPVEKDGSAYMELPANRSFFFVALDANDLSVKRMQSFTTVMPGENSTCVGCHEERNRPAPVLPPRLAFARPANKPRPIPGTPQIIDYPRDIQPVWDRRCLACHDVDKRCGGVLLTGDNGPHYTLSYFELVKRLQVADGRNNIRSNYAPRTIGSSASPLLAKVDGSHHNATLSARELRLVKLWIDASANYIGTYAGLRSGMIAPYVENKIDRFDLQWPSVQAAGEAMGRRCNSCHSGDTKLASSPSDNLGLNTWQLTYNGGREYLYPLPWLAGKSNYATNVGSAAWMKKYADRRLQFHQNTIYNLTRPEKSVILLAPLAKAAGGYGTCGDVFVSTSDADYQALLKMVQDEKAYLDKLTRFNMPDFKPHPTYVAEMKRYGILPAVFKAGDRLNAYETDEKYFESFWWKPAAPGLSSGQIP